MLRKLLLPMLATAVLAGCATDYSYRNGNGDYYYGQPRVEYRQLGPSGFYGGYGLEFGYGRYGGSGYGPAYFYDRYGRLVYGYPGGYYGSPYYGGNGWYRPRPNHGHGEPNDHGGDANNPNRNDRPPPWRDLGGLQQRDENKGGFRNRDDRQRPMRRPSATSNPDASTRPQRSSAPAPVIRQRSEPSSRTGGFINRSSRPQGKRSAPPVE